ncbi:MBL fold metallo-hydrolase [Candidatus Poribacteria bacterium]|nr:MBL fold metallo-hydrolase [Candidatus Poribacteria bacterium]
MEQFKTTVTFLGTSTVVPAAGHDTASFLINRKYLMDTGWYSAIKMLQYGFSPMALEYLFISHCHHDHYIGLPHILFYLRMRRNERPDRPPLKIIGPAEDIQLVVELARQFLQTARFPDVECIPDVFPLTPGKSFEEEAFRVDTCATVHAVQSLCYKFTDKKTGATIAFTGDTGYHPPIAEHVKGVSLLIHEASHGPNSPTPGPEVGHSGAPDAAKIARAGQVKQLALIHCPENLADAALAAAQEIFPNTFFPKDSQKLVVEHNA